MITNIHKISFKDHTRNDIEYRVKWLNDPEINRFIGNDTENTDSDKQKQWFDRYDMDDSKHCFTICSDNNPIGVVGLSHIDKKKKQSKLFVLVGNKNFWGKGIGTQAVGYITKYGFEKLELEKIIAEVYENNIPARRCYEKAGFIQETSLGDEKQELNNKTESLITYKIERKLDT